MSDTEFERLRALISERLGIWFTDEKRDVLAAQLRGRLRALGLRSYREYYWLLRYGRSDDEWDELIERVTTQETFFHRHPEQFQALVEGVLPSLWEGSVHSSGSSIKIWSAGCSTGEEPYSLAMSILDARLPNKGIRIDIIGTDVSRRALEHARQAEYTEWSLRRAPQHWLVKFFEPVSKSIYRVRPQVRAMVRFMRFNLLDARLPLVLGMVDVIFCRNVLMYFREDARQRVLQCFHNCLQDGGYLFLGPSDALFELLSSFQVVDLQHCIAYRKPVSSPYTVVDYDAQ